MKPCFALLVILTVFFTACQNDTSKSQSLESAAVPVTGPRYIRLTGTLAGKPVVLHLTSDNTVGSPNTNYAGQISWPDGSYTAVYSTPDNGNQLMLEANFHGQDSTEYYRIEKIMPSGSWTGVEVGSKATIQFTESYPEGSVRFVAKEWQDSLKARPELENSPVCDISQSVLVPNSGDPALDAWLLQSFLQAYGADSVAGKPTNFDALYTAQRKEMFDEYPETIKDYDPGKEDQYASMWSQSAATSMEILLNEGHRLTVAVTSYMYSGGAHGNYGSELFSYNLKTRKRLFLQDVLKPGYEKALAPYLVAAARRWAGLGASDALDSVYFVENNTIPFTENAGITDKGLIFNYVPYEIGAYALGEIRLFVPYTDIKSLMK